MGTNGVTAAAGKGRGGWNWGLNTAPVMAAGTYAVVGDASMGAADEADMVAWQGGYDALLGELPDDPAECDRVLNARLASYRNQVPNNGD